MVWHRRRHMMGGAAAVCEQQADAEGALAVMNACRLRNVTNANANANNMMMRAMTNANMAGGGVAPM